MPSPEPVEARDNHIGKIKHEPEEQAAVTASVAPEGFIRILGEYRGQGGDEDQRCKGIVGGEEAFPEAAPFHALEPCPAEGAVRVDEVRKKIEDAEEQENDAERQRAVPEKVKAALKDVKILVVGIERKDAEHNEDIKCSKIPGEPGENGLHLLGCFC